MLKVSKSMKALALAAVAAASLTMPAKADHRDFKIMNGSRAQSIVAVWFATPGNPNDPWKNVGLINPIAPLNYSKFTVNGGTSCNLDIKIRFASGQEQTFTNVNFCRVEYLLAA